MSTKPLFFLLLAFICLGNSAVAQQLTCPPNLDFETGTLNNWQFFTGGCCPITNTMGPGAPVAGRHELMSGTGVDPYGNFPVVAPGGGSYSLRLGNNGIGAQAERARYFVQVPANPNNIYTLLYSYAVVLQNPSHTAADQPRFEVTVFDSATGAPVPCNQFEFVSGVGLPGFQTGTNGVVFKPWATASIDLSIMAGRTVGIDFATGDCAQGGHFGYAYIDVACNFFQSYTLHCPDQPMYTLEGPPGFEKYDWRDNLNNTIGTTQNITIATPPSSSTFSLILEPYSGFGCPDTIYSSFIISNMTVDASLDTGVCKGSSVQLGSKTNSSAGPYTYNWTPSTGLSCVNCPDPVATPTAYTRYYVTITDKDGCDAMDSVSVRVDENVYTDITIDDTFCSHTVVDLTNGAVTNPPNANYAWNIAEDDGTVADGLGTSKTRSVWYTAGDKKVKLTVSNGRCVVSDSVYVYVNQTPQPEFEIFKNVCVGAPVKLEPKFVDGAVYQWDIEEQLNPGSNYQEVIPLQWNTVGRKKISLTLTSLEGCTSTKESFIGIQGYPSASIEVVKADNLCKGKTFELQATGGYRYEYSWRPAQYFKNNLGAKVAGVAEVSGYVYVDVTNQWDCLVTDSFYVNGDPCCDIFMPDAFTPNGDGRNDKFWSPDLDKHSIAHFMIANRRGEVVYESKSADKGWNGIVDGKPAAADTYNYFIKYRCNNKEEFTKKGTFILLR